MVVILKLRKIRKEYDGKQALRGINLDIKEGEIFSIIGPNGAGKTTLLRIMSFLDKPTGGEIFYKSKRVEKTVPANLAKKVTMVFQQPVLFNSTVFENIAYGLRLRNCHADEINRRVDEVLNSVKLRGFGGRRAKKLSGGEQQRVILARALVLNPELLLLDEPTANLDPVNTALIERIIKGLRGKTAVVVATHNLFQAKRLSDRVACLLEGRLIDVGETREIFNHPKDERTKKFIRGEFF
jgi:tungstate transport system ATP-binding protein